MSKAYDKIAAGLTEALEVARGNAKPEKTKVIGIGVHGAGPSARSHVDLRIMNGRHYIVIHDRDSGANTRTAMIALSPDNMIRLGAAMVTVGEGGELDDIDHAGFNRTSTVRC